MDSIGDRVDYLRRKDKLSYNDLAIVIENITSDGVRKAIVNDRLKEEQIVILCKTYNWNIDWVNNGGDLSHKTVSSQELLNKIDNKEIVTYIYNNRSDFKVLNIYKMLIEIECNDRVNSDIIAKVNKIESKLNKIITN